METVRSVASFLGAEVTCLYSGQSSVVSHLIIVANRLAGVQHEIQRVGSLEVAPGNVMFGTNEAVKEHDVDLPMVGRLRLGKVALGVQVSIASSNLAVPTILL